MKYIPGYGPLGAKVMILIECPSEKDVQSGKLASDTRLLDELLREAGILKQNCWITSVSKYHVPSNYGKQRIPFATRAKTAGVDIGQQIEELQAEVNAIKPNIIIGIGKSALWALTGKLDIEKRRGSILLGMGCKVVCTYNPEHLSWQAQDVEFRGYWNKQIMLFDLKRAQSQSHFATIELPKRILQVAKSSYEFEQFLADESRNHTRAANDIESGGHFLPVCSGFAFRPSRGMTAPLWNKDGISQIPNSGLAQIWQLIQNTYANVEIIGQNYNYDRDKMLRLGFTMPHYKYDIMMKAQTLNPEFPKALAFNQSLFTLEPYYKDEGMYEGTYQDLFEGCSRDCCVTIEIDEAMERYVVAANQEGYYHNFLMQLPDFYWEIEKQGFLVDSSRRDNLMQKYIEWSERLQYELWQITGTDINVNSPTQIGRLLYDNWKIPNKGGGTGEEEITAILNIQGKTGVHDPQRRRGCEVILEKRRVDKTIGTYIMAMPDFDGRMRTTVFPCLETGRSNTGKQSVPIRPTVEVRDSKGKKKEVELGVAFQTMTKHGDIGADVRSMYIPDSPDEVFIQADSSQAEARVIFRLANDEEALEAVDKHDYHALTASWFFGGTEDDYSKKKLGYEHPIRFAGKTLRHAGHLGAGKRRAAISVNTDARKFKVNIAIDEKTAERALTIFHGRQPKIRGVFQASVIAQLEKNRTLYAPVPYGFDSPVGGQRIFYERWGDELFRQAFSYIPQRAISDNTKGAGIRIKRRIPEIKIVMEAHDSLLFCIPRIKLREWVPIIKQEFERPIDFGTCIIKRPALIVPCEIEIGENYQELSKFRDYVPVVMPKPVMLNTRPLTITEQMMPRDLPEDSKLTDLIYSHQMDKLRK